MKSKIIINLLALILLFLSLVPGEVSAQEATFYVSPSNGAYRLGATFFVDVLINAQGIAINAAQTKIFFPSDKLEVVKISKQNSIFSLWPEEPVFSNSQGRISLLGGVPSPGFIGKGGKVISILFKTKSPGEAEVYFGNEKILANDPYGTDIFAFSQGGTYSIIALEDIIPLEEEPEKPKPKPPSVPEEEEVSDTEPPNPFDIIIDNEGDPTNPSPLLYFKTTDDISGVGRYEVKIKEEVFEVKLGENFPWRMPNSPPDTYQIVVKAIDRAGNSRESSTEVKIESIPIPEITVCPKSFRSGEEMLFVSGIAPPNSKVIIFFEKDKELIKEWEITSDGEGDWSIAKEGLFRPGVYQITAIAEDSRGARSLRSEPCSVKVILGGIAIGPLIVSYKTLNLIIIIILILLSLFVAYLVWRIKRTQRLIDIETKDLKTKFYKEYNELRTDIEKKLLKVKRIKDIRSHTEEEKVTEEELLKDLVDVERVIREELKDIEDIT